MRKLNISAGTIVGIVFFAIIAVYLFVSFFTKNAAGSYQFVSPTSTGLEGIAIWIMKAGIIAMAVWLGTWIMSKIAGGTPTRRDIISFIVIGIVVYILWEYVLVHVAHATSFNDITAHLGQKLGLLK